MVITLDLSAPRRLTSKVFNNIIFNLKMSGINIQKYRRATLLPILYIFLKNEKVMAAGSGTTQFQESINTGELRNYLELYGVLTCYSIYELLRAKESFIESVKFLSKTGNRIFYSKK